MKIVVEDVWMNDVPTSHYRMDDEVARPLVIACHGFQSDRFATVCDVAMQLARRGYHVVTLDAYMHGERSDVRFTSANDQQKGEMIFEIIFQTVEDIKKLIQTLEHHPLVLTDQIGITGVSMGGMTAHLTGATVPNVKVIVDMIGTPDYVTFVQDILGEENMSAYADEVNAMTPLNPIALYLAQEPKKILMCHGRHDNVVPINSVNRAYEQLVSYYQSVNQKDQVKYLKCFCQHEVPTEMKRAVYQWFETHLPVTKES